MFHFSKNLKKKWHEIFEGEIVTQEEKNSLLADYE